MHKLELNDELAKGIRENVFGDCTVVYESMTNSELLADLHNYLTNGSISKKTGSAIVRQLTPNSLKDWLKFRLTIELYDLNPETPFDRSDDEIARANERERQTKERLTANINKFIEGLKK